jgi:hypothetical protein
VQAERTIDFEDDADARYGDEVWDLLLSEATRRQVEEGGFSFVFE